jgi:hypothetical protein
VPLGSARTQHNLGNALLSLGERESGTARIEKAFAAYKDALKIFEEAGADYFIEIARRSLHRAESALPEMRWREGHNVEGPAGTSAGQPDQASGAKG